MKINRRWRREVVEVCDLFNQKEGEEMIRSINEVKIYETDNKEVPVGESVEMKVCSHWNRRELVVLQVKGVTVSVLKDDLLAAIENATNTARY